LLNFKSSSHVEWATTVRDAFICQSWELIIGRKTNDNKCMVIRLTRVIKFVYNWSLPKYIRFLDWTSEILGCYRDVSVIHFPAFAKSTFSKPKRVLLFKICSVDSSNLPKGTSEIYFIELQVKYIHWIYLFNYLQYIFPILLIINIPR